MSDTLITAMDVSKAAVDALSPYLTEAGKEAAKAVGKEVAGQGFKLLGWMRDKLTGRGAEALAELEQAPADADNQGDVRKQLTKLLTDNPALLDELRALLTEKMPEGQSLVQNAIGNNIKLIQSHGIGNHNSIS
ncbi:hypothetical protein ABMY26_22835 [Azospirillum sp. HJ39]|uniref:hypothetical protein n=1 Tax=Azospirillum sp. HJ39 TaxID=3159496 RepID=UPI003556A7A9